MLLIIVDARARDNVPPSCRMKFRNAVTTEISFLETLGCAAIVIVC